MASTKEYLDFVLEQLSELDEVSSREMMGEYILYYRGRVFGGIYDRSNLIALCKSCHSTIHAKRGDYWGQRAPAKPASWEEDAQ